MWNNNSSESGGGGQKMLVGMMNRTTIDDPPGQHRSSRKDLPPLFWFMETGDWEKAVDRIRRHPKEVKTWATLRTKSAAVGEAATISGSSTTTTTTTKRLALHHACFKLRAAGAMAPNSKDDPFVEVCRFILLLIKLDPDAAQKRESRHGCLPLHLASFASCAPREVVDEASDTAETKLLHNRPVPVGKRQSSDATNDTQQTNMSAVHAEETYTGAMSDIKMRRTTTDNPNVSVSMRANTGFSAKREEMLVQVINALLDAYPKAARVDSEGGRLPLHTACAGRATPRVVQTLITAYPAGARQRNKDGFLPLHLAAHWGVSHIAVAVQLLKIYPDATVGRNRWERTPLEEALCMAGENGRPHQAALVRALRKHPSWWTRPQSDFRISPTGGMGGGGAKNRGNSNRQLHLQPRQASTAVDIDESLPSNDSTFDDQVRMHQQEQRAHQQHLQHQYGDDGFGFDTKEDDIDEMDLPPSPPNLSPSIMQRLSPMTLLGKTKKGSVDMVLPDPLGVGVSLAHLIERRQWSSVVARIRQDPMEAEQELQVMTRGGFTASTGMSPLHYACERKPPAEVARLLMEAFPVATLTRAMPGGCLPLHIACTWGGSAEVVKVLLAADSGSVRIKDELGNVALHSACFSGADSKVIEALLQSDGKSVLARNHQGSRPIDICKRLRHENRKVVMDMLTRKKEEIMRLHNRDGSSGVLSEIAREAEEMNQRNGTPGSSQHARGFRDGDDLHEHHAGGVEVTYDEEGNGQDELVWV